MNARQLAQQLLLLAMKHPDEEIEVIVDPSFDDEGEPYDMGYSPGAVTMKETTYTNGTFHEIHISEY